MELFKEYLKERENKEVIENEYGFLIYKIFGKDKECFIADFYIRPAFRKTVVVGNFINELKKIGLEHGCETMTACLQVSDAGHKRTLLAALKLGFNIISANNNSMVILKNLGGC
jgi:hypothetical protein